MFLQSRQTVRSRAASGRWRCGLALLILIWCPSRVWAGEVGVGSADHDVTPPDTPVQLETLLGEAFSRNPTLHATKERWLASTHRIAQAWSLPDPSAGYMIMGDMIETRLGPQEDVFEVEQTVPFPGKLWERRKMAQAEAQATKAAYQMAERDIVRDVSSTFYDLYATDASIRVVEELLERLKTFEQVAQARYASGGGSQRDVAKAQGEVSMALERLFVLRQQRQTLAARMNALLNRRGDTPLGPLADPSRPSLTHELDELLRLAEQSRPELQQASSMVERDRHAKTLARLEYVPDLAVGFQYVSIGSGMTTDPDDGRDAWMVPLKLTIPLWQNRLVPAIQEAKRNLKASEAGLDEEVNRTEYEVKESYYRYKTSVQVVELYENALLPEADLAFRSDQAGYEAGRQDILNLIDSERVSLDAQVAYHQALAGALKSFAELERAVGRRLQRTDTPQGGAS